ncbi:MAG: HNH endonuclease, partial [Aliifodinibius sp.]|nr:HNH endonuclease [Fodinibius sp.]
MSKVVRSKSEINYSYATIKITQSRIDKGLIAIPVSLIKWFPDRNDTIQVYLSNSPVSQDKHYSSYRSSTRECRIGGMKEWFRQNNIKSGDEIVIQFID